jgi:glycosyltransferase involved in cell wall biosynthesis
MAPEQPSVDDGAAAGELCGLDVLLLSYYFPPLASAGGHRTGALARNLARHGAGVTVVTVKHGLDVSDEALLAKLPPQVRVVRVPSFEGAKLRGKARDRYKHEAVGEAAPAGPARKALMAAAMGVIVARSFVPWAFRRTLFGLRAMRACRREIRQRRPDVLVVSLGPMCQTWAALLAARGSGVPVVFDFRDLWTPAPEYYKNFLEHRVTRPVRWIDRPLERWAMRRADYFVANHEHMARTMESFEPHTRGRTVVIPNGYDEDDFADIQPVVPQADRAETEGRQAVVRSMGTTYIGTVGALMEAVRRLPAAAAERLSVELIGPYYETSERAGRGDGIEVVRVRPPLPHREALQEMAAADSLLFLLRDTPGIDDMVPARLYEYLRLGRPVLAVAPPGAAQELVDRHGGTVIHPADVDGLARALEQIATGGPLPGAPNPSDPGVRSFERSAQALALGRTLTELADGGNR